MPFSFACFCMFSCLESCLFFYVALASLFFCLAFPLFLLLLCLLSLLVFHVFASFSPLFVFCHVAILCALPVLIYYVQSPACLACVVLSALPIPPPRRGSYLSKTRSWVNIKVAATDVRYFARSKFSRSLVYKKNFSLILQVIYDTYFVKKCRICLLSLSELGKKSQGTIILDKFVSKP